jgi:hypothetical protein
MGSFFRRAREYFMIGFIITFIVYLYIKLDGDDLLLGIIIAAAGGIALAVALFILGSRFPDEAPNEVGQRK